MTQEILDASLDREHIIPVQISEVAPLPLDNDAYDPVRHLQQSGLTITLRELLHAIGCKVANLPISEHDDCLRAGLLMAYTLDLENQTLRFKQGIESDVQTPLSQFIGIGITCLLAGKSFDVPWDQLGALPGPGFRFDYRGNVNGFNGIFESKGTSYRGNQAGQINHGIQKKNAHHERGEHFDVELIISSFIGRNNDQPRIMIGDPNFDELAKIYDSTDNRFFRLRHYVRILQFLGFTKSAFQLNKYALSYLKGDRTIRKTILLEKQTEGFLDIETFGNNRYFGRWFDTVLPQGSKRYKEEKYGNKLLEKFGSKIRPKVFQGIREDFYHAGFGDDPFSHKLLSDEDIEQAFKEIDLPVSIFSDGTIQLFKAE